MLFASARYMMLGSDVAPMDVTSGGSVVTDAKENISPAIAVLFCVTGASVTKVS
jgi:hypothetical protein